MSHWKNEKTKLVASWLLNTPEIRESAMIFTKQNPNLATLYRAWVKAEGFQDVVTPDGIRLLDLELHFAELNDILRTLTI